jgi:hypothetical protein
MGSHLNLVTQLPCSVNSWLLTSTGEGYQEDPVEEGPVVVVHLVRVVMPDREAVGNARMRFRIPCSPHFDLRPTRGATAPSRPVTCRAATGVCRLMQRRTYA